VELFNKTLTDSTPFCPERGLAAASAALRRHKIVDRGGPLKREPFSPAFQWPEQYDHSLRGKCKSEASLNAFRCRPGRDALPRALAAIKREERKLEKQLGKLQHQLS